MSAVPQLETLEAEVDHGLGALIVAAKAELSELERQRSQLDEKIAAHTRRIRTWETTQRTLRQQPPRLRALESAPATKRDAVLAFLADYPDDEFKLIDIRRALIERGWMTNAQSHALEVAVVGMAQRGEIQRVRKGIYTLRPRIVEAAWTDESIGVQS